MQLENYTKMRHCFHAGNNAVETEKDKESSQLDEMLQEFEEHINQSERKGTILTNQNARV